MSWMWIIINFVGPMLLLGTLVWATIYTRRGRRARLEREAHERKEAHAERHTYEGE